MHACEECIRQSEFLCLLRVCIWQVLGQPFQISEIALIARKSYLGLVILFIVFLFLYLQ